MGSIDCSRGRGKALETYGNGNVRMVGWGGAEADSK